LEKAYKADEARQRHMRGAKVKSSGSMGEGCSGGGQGASCNYVERERE